MATFSGSRAARSASTNNDDILGKVTIVSMKSGDLIVETGEVDSDGKPMQQPRTFGHIRAKSNATVTVERAAATGRPGQAKGGIFHFFGAAGAAASPTVQRPKRKGKGLGKTMPAASAPEVSAPAAAGKRKAPAEDNSGILAQLGAQHADSTDDEGEEAGPSQKRVKGGSVSIRKMDSEQKSEYSNAKYHQRKEKLQVARTHAHGTPHTPPRRPTPVFRTTGCRAPKPHVAIKHTHTSDPVCIAG